MHQAQELQYVSCCRAHVCVFSTSVILIYKNTMVHLTNSMEQSPSWEANRFSASQVISPFYGIRRFIAASTRACYLSLSWAGWIQSTLPPFHFLKIYLNIIIPSTPGSSKWSVSQVSHQNPVCTSCLPCVLHVLPISFLIRSPETFHKASEICSILQNNEASNKVLRVIFSLTLTQNWCSLQQSWDGTL
jgi:hypothetical protein